MVTFHIVTLFPESIMCYFKSSMVKRAIEDKKIKVEFYNPRDFTKDKFKRVDRKPFGGGPGMVLEAESILRAVEKAAGKKKGVEVIFFSPSGEQFTTDMAKQFAQGITQKEGRASVRTSSRHLVMICGRYEGVDARVPQILNARHISVGPFVLTGGELPAAIMVDAIARYIPGVLGKHESLEDERIASPEVYTRPEVLVWKKKKYAVPDILLSGHHKNIEAWRDAKRKRE